jgi:hypothetical protein
MTLYAMVLLVGEHVLLADDGLLLRVFAYAYQGRW